MTLAQLVNEVYLCYRGKLSNVPASGDEKYTRILTIINRNQRQWALDSNVDWPSRYETRTIGTSLTGTQTYNLPTDVIRLSDFVQLGAENYVPVVKPHTIAGVQTGCYVSGANPMKLTFLTDITAANTGKSIIVPCFTLPADLSAPTDVVAVDNPQWLVYASAAELARNDYSKEEQYPNLNGIANDLYQNMVNEAESSSFLQANGVPNGMTQYDGFGANSSGWPF